MEVAKPKPTSDDAASRVCFAYFNALGQLQNSAPEAALAGHQPALPAPAAAAARELAQEVVRAHRDMSDLIGVLEREHSTELLQRQRLQELREQDEQVTERLRGAVTAAEAARARVQEGLRRVERDHLSSS
jgi:hypothetical protein